jgi:hypothetical protein
VTDWGLPDWTKREEYPAPRGPREMTIWAWEFLRRNPEYRVFWKEKIEPFIDKTVREPPNNELKARVVSGGIYRDAAGKFWPYLDELRARFGVENPSPPQSATPSHFAANYISWVENERGEEDQRISLERHQVAYIFDLTRPLKRQFEMAKKSATREQESRQKSGAISLKESRSRTDCYVRYLRVLDADEAHEEPRRIADSLFPGIPGPPENSRLKALHDDRLAARDLRDGKYRSLLEAPLRK